MMEDWSTLAVLLFLLFSGAVTWMGGVHLSESTEALARRFKWGQSVAGSAVVAVITNLPECAIATFAALHGATDLLLGNVLGGIATQTMVIVLLDAQVAEAPLTTKASHPSLIFQGAALVAILGFALLSTRVRPLDTEFPYAEASLFAAWVLTLTWLYFRRKSEDEHHHHGHDDADGKDSASPKSFGARRPGWVFAISSVATFAAGLGLSMTVEEFADRFHLDGVVMGATVLAGLTALPEISSALAATRLKAYRMALSDVIGGNLFMPALLLPVALVLKRHLLFGAETPDIYFTALALLITAIFTLGFVFKSRWQWARLGASSWFAVGAYLLGVGGAFWL